jgi:hypothetical protein
VPQDFHAHPGPERAFLIPGQVQPSAAGADAIDVPGTAARIMAPPGGPGDGELPVVADLQRGLQPLPGRVQVGADLADLSGQYRGEGPGPLVYRCLAVPPDLSEGDLRSTDRARGGEPAPPNRVLRRPGCRVGVEGPDVHQGVLRYLALLPGAARVVADDLQPQLPRRSDLRGQVQRADPGMMQLQVPPEQQPQVTGQVVQRGVVHRWPADRGPVPASRPRH